MVRLPIPGGDGGDWGTILNDFLSQSHNTDGTLKDDSVGSAQLQSTIVDSKVDKGTLVFNVKDYGAVGNWSSGTAGTDDTAAINACLSAAAASAHASKPLLAAERMPLRLSETSRKPK